MLLSHTLHHPIALFISLPINQPNSLGRSFISLSNMSHKKIISKLTVYSSHSVISLPKVMDIISSWNRDRSHSCISPNGPVCVVRITAQMIQRLPSIHCSSIRKIWVSKNTAQCRCFLMHRAKKSYIDGCTVVMLCVAVNSLPVSQSLSEHCHTDLWPL